MSDAQRTPDAVRMDAHYRFQRHVYDYSRRYFLLGRMHLIRDLGAEPGESVLEIGCGTAWNLVQTAAIYPRATCFGIDVSDAMLETARASLKRKSLADRVVLQQADATGFDAESLFGRSTFDRVFISYALSMIPRWRDALEHASNLIAPGGALHVVDFGQCEQLPGTFKSSLQGFLRYNDVTPRTDLRECFTSIASTQKLDLRFTRLYRGYTDYAVASRPLAS